MRNLMTNGTHSILGFLDVNGLATDASAFDSDIPELAIMFILLNSSTVHKSCFSTVILTLTSFELKIIREKE